MTVDNTKCVHCGFGHFAGHYTSSDACINKACLFFKPVEAQSNGYEAMTVNLLLNAIGAEVHRAGTLFAPMNSPHEAAFVIEEEWEEYRQEVFKHNTSKPDRDTRPRQREELIQLAAMCMRAILDTIDSKSPVLQPIPPTPTADASLTEKAEWRDAIGR